MTTLDLEGAPEVRSFYGRNAEVDELTRILCAGDHRLLVVHGLGGAGKTRLGLGLILQPDNRGGLGSASRVEIEARFRHVVWRDLVNSPPLAELLRDLVASLPEVPDQEPASLKAPGIDHDLKRLTEKLRAFPCLVILDNVESLLEVGDLGSILRSDRGEYAAFFSELAGRAGDSCLVLTTREVPTSVDELCGGSKAGIVRNIRPLELDACRRILENHGVVCSGKELESLADVFGHNALLLELAAKRIVQAYGGDAQAMLDDGDGLFVDFRKVLDWHFARLSEREMALATCLAIAREPLTPSEIAKDLLGERAHAIADDIVSIENKILLERRGGGFTLHPVLVDYLNIRIVDQVAGEILRGEVALLDRHALLKATAKEHVSNAQRQLILAGILNSSVGGWATPRDARQALLRWLDLTRSAPTPGFAAGNILNLLCACGEVVEGLDFSGMVVRSAFLRDSRLVRCDFTGASMIGCAFAASMGAVLSVAVSPDGKEVVAGDNKGGVRAWQVSDGSEIRAYVGHRSWVRAITFTRDGLKMATAGSDYEVRIWESRSGRCLHVLRGHSEQVYSVDFDLEGRFLASGGEDGRVVIWDPVHGVRTGGFEIGDGRVRSVRFDPTGKFLAVAAGRLSIWRIPEMTPMVEADPLGRYVRRATFSPDGSKLAAIDSENKLRILDSITLQAFEQVSSGAGANWLEYSADGRVLAAGCEDGSIRRWSVGSGIAQLPTFLAHDGSVRAIALGASADLVVSGGEDRFVKISDLRESKVLHTIRGEANGIRGLAWSKVDGTIAVACENGKVELWKTAGDAFERERVLTGHDGIVEGVAFHPSGTTLASVSDDGTVRLWDRRSGQATVLAAHRGWVWCLAFDDSGRTLLTGSRDRTAILWDPATQRQLRIFEGHQDEVHCVAFMSDGVLASGSDDKTIRIWDSATGAVRKVIAAHDDCVRTLAYSHARGILASGSDDETIKLWDVSGNCLGTLRGHVGRVRSVAFDTSGERLLSVGDDASVRIWDVGEKRGIGVLDGHERGIWSLDVDAPGNRVVAGGEDGSFRVWDIATGRSVQYWPERPYEGSVIADVEGLLPAEVLTWTALGAVVQAIRSAQAETPSGETQSVGGAANVAVMVTIDNARFDRPADGGPSQTEDLLAEFANILADHYPEGPQSGSVWSRAGGDMSFLSPGLSGREAWYKAIRLLRQGGGGKDLDIRKLLEAVAEDFPRSDSLPRFRELLAPSPQHTD